MAEEYYDFLLNSHRFNLSQKKDYYMTDTNYGDDIALWMQEALQKEGFEVVGPEQEEWGWFLTVSFDDSHYVVVINGTPVEIEDLDPNLGEWRLSVQKLRTTKEKLLGKNKMTLDENILVMMRRIMANENDMRVTGVEKSLS